MDPICRQRRRTGFAVPVALEAVTRRVTRPETAKSGTDYACPQCQGAVRPRCMPKPGKLFRSSAHFFHRSSATCTGESVIHAAAKVAIIQGVQDWRENRGSRPLIAQSCSICYREVRRPIPSAIVTAVPEVAHSCTVPGDITLDFNEQPVQDESVVHQVRFDVGLMSEHGLAAAVEVFKHHEVVRPDIFWLKIPWLEVNADDVLQDPLLWRPRRHALADIVCGDCVRQTAAFEEKLAEVAEECGLSDLPGHDILSSLFRCRSCAKLTVVHCWQNVDEVSDCTLEGDEDLKNVWVATWPALPPAKPHRAEHNHCYRCRACISWGWLLNSAFGGIPTDCVPLDSPETTMRLANNALDDKLFVPVPPVAGPGWTGMRRIDPMWEWYQ